MHALLPTPTMKVGSRTIPSPASAAARQGVLAAGKNVAAAFNTTSSVLTTQQNALNTPVAQDVNQINQLAQQMKLVADDITVVVLKGTGHWILEERPKETTDALVKFL